MSAKNDRRLVWSDDPRDRAKIAEADAPKVWAESVGGDWTAVFRIEKAGRAGKTVTVLERLPRNEEFLRGMCKELKNKCGSGGTFDAAEGRIEIQGDQRVGMKDWLDKKGYRYKGM
jgi:translation initiation factor 1